MRYRIHPEGVSAVLFADQVRNRLRLGRSLRATVEPLQPEVHPGNSFSPMGTWRRRFLLMATNGPWNTWGIYFGTRVRIEENISEPLCEIASDEIVGAGGQRVASTRLGALCRRQRKAGNVTRITSHQHSSSDCYFRTSMCQKR